MEETFLGVDIGTSGVKAALFDTAGNQLALSYREYHMIFRDGGIAELDPQVIFDEFIVVVRECLEMAGRRPSGIGISTQMHSTMGVGKDVRPLTNLIPWADTRSLAESEYIETHFVCRYYHERAGCRVQHPIYPLSKILWFERHEPRLFAEIDKFVSIKTYILHRLMGELLADITDASASSLFNIHQFDWDEEILRDILNVDKSKFAPTVDITTVLRGIKPEYAAAMGISPHTPVVIGSGDGIMANLACAGVDAATMSCTIGTSGALRFIVDKPAFDPRQRTWCFCFTRDKWVTGGAINNGGIVLKWLREQHRTQYEHEAAQMGLPDAYKLFDEYAVQVPVGCDGLLFLPYLTGERSPGWNAQAKGYLCGIKLSHDKRHIVRAAMEGIMYNMYSIYNIIEKMSGGAQRIVANGGYAKSAPWLQIQADIFGKDIMVPEIGEAAAYGAAMTAMVALGATAGFDTLPVLSAQTVHPSAQNHALYEKSYAQFSELYEMLIAK